MGFILSKFRRKKSTQEVLETLEKEIKRISNNKRQSLVSQSTVVKKILIYGLIFWVLAFGCVFYLYRSAQRTEDYIIFLPILFLIPTFLFFFRRVSTWWYHSKISKDDAKLTKLKEEKSKILDEVMEKETYKVATQILEKYDPSRLPGKSAETVAIAGPRPAGGSSLRPQPMVVANSPHGSRNPTNSPRGGGMDLRKRVIPNPGQQSLNQSMSMPASRKEVNAVNMNQTIGAPGRSPMPPGAGGGPPPGMVMSRGGMPPGGMGRGGPPLPRPIIPRERGYMDRVVEYLVGDGPSNRYALICRQCQSHNGMALREEFEYISYRCCYCHYWNPARKQRPVAPRLPDPPPTPPTPVAAKVKEPLPSSTASTQGSEKGSPNPRKDISESEHTDDEKADKETKKEVINDDDDNIENNHSAKDENTHSVAEEGDNSDKDQDNEIGNIENEEENTMEENYDEDIKNFEKEDLSDDLMSKDDHDLSDEEENDNFATGDDNFELLAETTNKSEHIELINKDSRTDDEGIESDTPLATATTPLITTTTSTADESMEVDS